ncbi:PAAR domain-containing protein [Paraburkholderia sediminicola]|uniref:PAAR domain-containing protein n=1 Tax=Paraburkholderia sediminicola TaxID=458836 RepID=UPI000F2A3113
MTIFYSVVEDDPLDSGGNSRVIDGLADSTIEGHDGRHRRQTFLGHKAWCDRCKSAGEIIAAAGCRDSLRTFDATLGRYEALGDDKVLCNCPSPPRIIPVYGRSSMIIDDTDGVSNWAAAAASRQSSGESRDFDEQVRSVVCGAVLAGYPYFIKTADGRTSYGRTDVEGNLPRIETQEAKDYTVYWGDDALAKQPGS